MVYVEDGEYLGVWKCPFHQARRSAVFSEYSTGQAAVQMKLVFQKVSFPRAHSGFLHSQNSLKKKSKNIFEAPNSTL